MNVKSERWHAADSFVCCRICHAPTLIRLRSLEPARTLYPELPLTHAQNDSIEQLPALVQTETLSLRHVCMDSKPLNSRPVLYRPSSDRSVLFYTRLSKHDLKRHRSIVSSLISKVYRYSSYRWVCLGVQMHARVTNLCCCTNADHTNTHIHQICPTTYRGVCTKPCTSAQSCVLKPLLNHGFSRQFTEVSM